MGGKISGLTATFSPEVWDRVVDIPELKTHIFSPTVVGKMIFLFQKVGYVSF